MNLSHYTCEFKREFVKSAVFSQLFIFEICKILCQNYKKYKKIKKFEHLYKDNSNKHTANTMFVSSPSEKANIEDVKQFAEQKSMRKQIATDAENERMDDKQNYDDLDKEHHRTLSARHF